MAGNHPFCSPKKSHHSDFHLRIGTLTSKRASGVWQKPKKDHAPLAVLFDRTSRSDKSFLFAEQAVTGHVNACYESLIALTMKIDRARKRHVGLKLLAGKAP